MDRTATGPPSRSNDPSPADYEPALSETLDVLRTIASDYRPAVLANAFGPESMIMTDLIAKHGLDIEIFSIDTGRLPEETHALAHSVHQRYGPVIQMVSPDADEVRAWTAEHGQNGFYDAVEHRHGCCGVRKVAPLRESLAGRKAWLTGLRRQQSATRRDLEVSAWDEAYGLHKFNPMLDWTTEQVWAYIHDHAVPYNRLHDRGYTSIGCAPCTRAISPGRGPARRPLVVGDGLREGVRPPPRPGDGPAPTRTTDDADDGRRRAASSTTETDNSGLAAREAARRGRD